MADFRSRLIAARTSKGWTQAELARRSGVSRGTIVAWEKNPQQQPEADPLARVAAALGKDVSDLQPSGEVAPITTPARLHSWLNEHLETVIAAEVERRVAAEFARYGLKLPVSDAIAAELREAIQAFEQRAGTGAALSTAGLRSDRARQAAQSPQRTTASASSRQS